jgi:uncharacterized protein (TIGR04141 family)
MPPKTQVLAIYLLKKGFTQEKQYLRNTDVLHKYTVPFPGNADGALYVAPSKEKPPRWVSFVSPAVAELPQILTSSASALLVVSRIDSIFILTFGYARSLLVPGCYEEDFGLKVTLNSVDAQRILSVDRQSFDAIGQHSRIQASREANISEFGLDLEQDMLRAVTGKPNDPSLGRQLTGKEALHATLPIKINELPAMLDKYCAQWKNDAYKQNFPWVDQIRDVKDPILMGELNDKLIERLTIKEHNRLWLSIPEILDWTMIEGFKYGPLETSPLREDVRIQDYMEEVKPVKIDLGFLKRRQIRAVSANDDIIDVWPLYRCLYCEIDLDNDTYLLTNGKWYRVGSQFLERVNIAYADMPVSSLELPNYIDKSEGAYNTRIAAELPGQFALLDQKFIMCDGPRDKVELCDLYSKDKKFVHVKRYAGASAPLSHLFAQAVVAGTLFRRDIDFRQKANALLPDGFGPITASPSAKEYEIVLAVASTSKNPLVLPFFSRVNLRNVRDRLEDQGYSVSLLKIQA